MDALKSTGPRSVAGKRASSQNSRKHGLNSAASFESSPEYSELIELIAEDGFSGFACANIAAGLLNYRRVMDAYYDTYTSPEPVDEFLRDSNVKASDTHKLIRYQRNGIARLSRAVRQGYIKKSNKTKPNAEL